MPLIPQSEAIPAMARYQRQLLRAVLPAVGIFAGIMVTEFFLYLVFSDNIPHSYRTAVGIVLSISVVAAMQIPMASLRRHVRELSVANGLVCPTCQTPLGDAYATLKRTGKCKRCGGQVIDAV
jgi:hypothetical protein